MTTARSTPSVLGDAAQVATKMTLARSLPDKRSAGSTSTVSYRRLRVLIVDDNRINLSVLSTLLKRRFGDLLEGSPIAVDSALKAIQLLRTQVFDLILMDIQMPFLSGLDATLRIRAGDDGVHEANRGAHIVAVTTAIGDEPELAYRRAGMDGMIGKPVRFQDISSYLCPLAHEAFNAASSVEALDIADEPVMPPLPPATPTNGSERLFYMPTDGSARAPPPDICHGSNFELMLRAQTRASLRNSGAMAVARAGTWHASTSPSRGAKQCDGSAGASACARQEVSESISEEEGSDHRSSASESRSNSSEALEPATWHERKPASPKQEGQPQSQHRHVRTPSTYSKRTLSLQIAREMEKLADSSDLSDAASSTRKAPASPSRVRPAVIHRVSSPSCLTTSLTTQDNRLARYVASPLNVSDLDKAHYSMRRNDNSTTPDSGLSSEGDDGQVNSSTSSRPTMLWDFDRRDSAASNGSNNSDVSTEASTPASEHPYCAKEDCRLLRPVGGRPLHYFSRDRHSTRGGVVEPWLSAGESAAAAAMHKDASLRSPSRPRTTHVHTVAGVEQLTCDLEELATAN